MTNVVLGGGISGLATAFYLSKHSSCRIKIFESSERLGGWIKSTRNENGTVFEHGPRTLRCRGLAAETTLQLVNDLGLSNLIVPVLSKSAAARNRLIYVDNQLVTLNTSLTAFFRVSPPFIKPYIFAIIKDLTTSRKSVSDESIYEFVTRRFGKQYADVVLSAVVCGIFAGDAKEISVKALMNNLFEKEQQYGSVIGGLIYSLKDQICKNVKIEKSRKNMQHKNWSVWSLKEGLETLPNHLSNYLKKRKNIEIHLNSKCDKVSFEQGHVQFNINGEPQVAKHLYSCLPSKDLARILGDEFSLLKVELSSIPFVTVAVVNLEYDGDFLNEKGFGFLVPPSQNLPILGIIFDSCIFPQKGKTVLTVMMGGKWFDHHFGQIADNSVFLKIAQDHVRRILKIDRNPSNSMVNVMNDCIPQYIVGHSDRIKRVRDFIAEHKLPLTLIGNSFDGVGVNDAVFSAKRGVESTLKTCS